MVHLAGDKHALSIMIWFHQQIKLRLYAIIYISIDYTLLYSIVYDFFDYLRLYYYKAIIRDLDYCIISQKTIITPIWFHLFVSAYIIALIAIMHDYVHDFYCKLLYVIFYLRWIILIIVSIANHVHYAHYLTIIRIFVLSY
jgi:hypothetical protein